jgi:hypothetical protein
MKNSILVAILVLSVRCAIAQSVPPASWKCIPREFSGSLRLNDPVYSEALQLSQVLSVHGIQVKCVLRSKMARFFLGQKGAALYRTDQGDFEALFGRPEDFANINVVEQAQPGGRYVYNFHGTPDASGMQSARRTYFAKHGGTFVMTSNEQIAVSLKAIFGSQ